MGNVLKDSCKEREYVMDDPLHGVIRKFSFVITARLRRFSSSDDGGNSALIEYEVAESQLCRYDDEYKRLLRERPKDIFQSFFEIAFYANGNCTKNGGYVSITFRAKAASLTLSCTAFVIDASGNKRFPQSLVVHPDIPLALSLTEELGFERYLGRSTLLGDPDELLPDDCLTLRLEIDFENCYISPEIKFYELDLQEEKETGECYLLLGTELERDLCEMSGVFRDMTEFAAGGSGAGRIRITHEEFNSFLLLSSLYDEPNVRVTLSDIRQMYTLADKYDMQCIIRLCHQWLTSVTLAIGSREELEMVEGNIREIYELAERFEDDGILREILKTYSDIKEHFESGNRKVEAPIATFLESEWECTHIHSVFSRGEFVFINNKIKISVETDKMIDMDAFK